MSATAAETDFMPIDRIPDWDQRLDRQDAWWHGEIIDRPVVIMTLRQPDPAYPPPAQPHHATWREWWFDAEYQAARALHGTMNIEFLGDALPAASPNLGPEVFSAFFGTPLEFGERTSWSTPTLEDWDRAATMWYNTDNEYWRGILALTDAFLAAGAGKFYTGITDLHPGGDAIAAFRDPETLAMDMVERPEAVKALVDRVTDAFCEIYEHFYNHLCANRQAITCWAGVVSRKKWYIPSNDFSCMISKPMFDDTFLPGIRRECQHLAASMYHLDGPQALTHLDSILAIPELSALQWVYGAGNGRATDWLEIYQKAQAAGKSIQLHADLDELDTIMEHLRPEGVWMSVRAGDRESAAAILKRVAKWT